VRMRITSVAPTGIGIIVFVHAS